MFSGSMVAVVTPMTPAGEIDLQAWEGLLQWHAQQGTDAVVVVGTTGESPTVTLAEAGEHDSARVLLKPFLKQAIKKEEQFRDWKKVHPDQTHDALWLFRSTEPVVATMLSRAEFLGLESYVAEIRRALTVIRTISNQ